MLTVVGRDEERIVAATFVAAAASGPAAMHIDGQPGIGKSTLFAYVTNLARAADSTLLESSPAASESRMGFVGLTDLLRNVPHAAFDDLPDVQRDSLAVATLRSVASAEPADERSVGTALATLLLNLTTTAPVIVAIDDLQWLDRSSADVVEFALRRIGDERIGVLTCAREGEPVPALGQAFRGTHWTASLALQGLGVASLFHIIRAELGVTLSRPALARVAEASGGNPLIALELTRSAERTAPGHVPAVVSRVGTTGWLRSLTAERLEVLSGVSREALLAVACSSQPTVAMLGVLGLEGAVDEAERDGTIRLIGDRIVFTHPLLADAVIGSASAPDLRAMHGRLAAASGDVEARARHQALAHPGRDEPTAVTLDEATTFAAARGSSIAALELARLAVDRTGDPHSEVAWRRRIRLGELMHAAGASADAAHLLDTIRDCPLGLLRARALLLLAEISYQTATAQEAFQYASRARAEARGDPALEATALLTLAVIVTDGALSAALAAEAKDLLNASGRDHPMLLAWAECGQVAGMFAMGRGLDVSALERALSIERTGRVWRSTDQVAAIRPVLLKWADHHGEALSGLYELSTRAEEEGNEGVQPYVLGHVPGILLRLGRFGEAATAAAEHLDLADRSGQANQRMQALFNVALVDAHLGRSVQAREDAQAILAWTVDHEDEWLQMSACAVLGFADLGDGDRSGARRWLDRWARLTEELNVIDPGISRFYGDHIEALVACGAVEEAGAATASLERRASDADRVSAIAIAHRCRALLAAHAGDAVGALSHIDASLEIDSTCTVIFERHRTTLLKGLIHRRAREKAAARRSLTEAQTGFLTLGAASWADRCADELQRIGTRVESPLALTATEQKVAELAASGLTTRQIAEQCFMSPKTVEAHLGKIYRKLNVSSRAALGTLLRG
ncbi:MAG: LuxR C-terminal-related transcriptional regulator [Ilumatobacteraceae bacterium]